MLNTKGAAARMGCSITWIRKLAAHKDAKKRIKAYVYLDGVLVEHDRNNPHPGQELFFREEDLDDYHSTGSGRSMGSKDKPGGKPREKKKTPKVTITLTDVETQLLIELLGLAENSFGNHDCNDFHLAKSVPDIEKRRELVKAFHDHNGDPETFLQDEERGETFEWFRDYALTGYLASKIRRQAEKEQISPIPEN